jgi:hypothetical protein
MSSHFPICEVWGSYSDVAEGLGSCSVVWWTATSRCSVTGQRIRVFYVSGSVGQCNGCRLRGLWVLFCVYEIGFADACMPQLLFDPTVSVFQQQRIYASDDADTLSHLIPQYVLCMWLVSEYAQDRTYQIRGSTCWNFLTVFLNKSHRMSWWYLLINQLFNNTIFVEYFDAFRRW